MSIVPLSFWLTILIGKLPLDTEKLFSLSVFQSVKNIFLYVQEEAANATTGASILLVLTTLYSATNLFYQMRKSGEIIYDFHPKNQGLKLRLGALLLLVIVMSTLLVFLIVFATGSFLFSRFLSRGWELFADYTLLTALAFVLALVLNAYICPYKAKWRDFLLGTLLTVGLWAIAVAGFSIYLKIGNLGRLYGALSAIIVFLLWLYILMVCFIIGVIFNSERIMKAQTKKKKRKKA